MLAKTNNKPDWIDYLFLIIIAYNIAPIVSRIISSTVTTYAYLGVLIVAIFFVLARNKGARLESYLTFLIPFVIWKAYLYFVSSPDLITWAYAIVMDFAPVLIGIYVVSERKKSVAVFVWAILFLVIATAITSIIFLIDDPNAARTLATISDANDELFVEYTWKNIGGYEFTYIFVLSYPIMILAVKKKKMALWLATILTVLLAVFIFYAAYTTALILFIISSFLWFMKKDLKGRDVFLIILIAVIVIVFFYGVLTQAFNLLADAFNDDEFAPRLRALAGGIEGIEGSEDDRFTLYMLSVNTFLRSPLIGTIFEYGSNSGHSFILDNLAMYGLVGGAAIAAIYYNVYRALFLRFNKYSGYGYVILVFAQTLLLSLVNTGMWLFFLGMIAPISFKYILAEGNNENSLDR